MYNNENLQKKDKIKELKKIEIKRKTKCSSPISVIKKKSSSNILKPNPISVICDKRRIRIDLPRSDNLIIHESTAFVKINSDNEENNKEEEEKPIIICSTCKKREAQVIKNRQYKTCVHCCKAKKARYKKIKRFTEDSAY